jgi:predicted acylesterase/phospholipase RssA/CRP-like cAMP-binding protein
VVAVASAVGDRSAVGEPAPVLAVQDGSAPLHLAPGDQLVARGDVADDVYVVVSGQLEVVLERATGTQQVSLLGPDDVIGEIGLLAGDARTATVRAVTACELVAISGDELRRIVAEDPERGRRLHRQATERLRRTLLIEQLTNLFGVIDQDVLGTIEHLIEWVAVPAGSLVFAEGDVGDAAYLVAVGRLRVLQRSRSGGGLVELGEVTRSGLVGELALLDGQPRRASVCAVRDSQLVRLSRGAYEELLQRYPEVGLTVAQTVLQLLNAGPRDARADRPLSVAVVATSARVDLDTFTRQLTVALGDGARRLTSEVIDEDLGRAGAAEVGEEEVGALRLAYHLEDLEQRHRRLVYQVGEVTTEWGRRALHSVDRILLVASSEDDAAPGRLERDLWQSLTGEHHPEVRLALLHPAGTLLPSGTAAWLDTRDLAGHHHLRDGDATHIGRLARLLAGTATSLVLGGGGARGFAHIGVLDVLEELDEPVDMVAGTSIGAIMAAGPGMGWTAAEMRTTAVDAFRNLFDYTLPTTSLLRGERITKKLWQRFGEARIEDMWLPYFCVSTNLTRAAVEFHDRGLLVPALRASIAIPGVLPPVPRDGDLLVDGGVLDNLPVEEMRRRNPSGRVVAIDVSLNDGPVAERDFGLSVGGGRAYLARRRGGGPPHLLATMVRSTLVAGARDRERAIDEKLADLYVEVAVDGGALLDFSAGSDIADSSMATTRPILKEWFSTVTPARTVVRTKPARRSIVQPGRRRHRRGVLLLTLRDLQHRASRFGAVIVGTSVVFALLYVMTGLTEQFHREPRDMVEALGADGWVVRAGATGAFTSAATMPADTAGAVTGAGRRPRGRRAPRPQRRQHPGRRRPRRLHRRDDGGADADGGTGAHRARRGRHRRVGRPGGG